MRRLVTYLLLVAPLLAQSVRPEPHQAPIDALIQSYQSAFSTGQYGEAAAKRNQARALIGQIPVNDPQFVNWVQRVSALYENGGFGTQARDVLEQALVKAGGLGETSSARIALLAALANAWQQDRNLLKSLSYLEQAVAGAEAQTTQANSGDLYQSLFTLYRRLGRPQDAAEVLARVTLHVKNSGMLLASLYQQQGRIDEAAAIYKREAAEAGSPEQSAMALQQLSNLYQSVQRNREAISGTRQTSFNLLSQGFLSRAAEAIDAGRMEEGFNLTLQAVDSATGVSDLRLANLAALMFVRRNQSSRVDEIYRHMITVAESWSEVTVAPLLEVLRDSCLGLLNQERWSEASQLMERYHATLTDARGSGTGWLEDALRLRTNAPERQEALRASHELVALEESLSGATSEPYLRAIETRANVMEGTGDREVASGSK